MNLVSMVRRHAKGKSPEHRREEAAHWFVTLQRREQLSKRMLKRWTKWESVAENREAYEAIERVWQLAGSVPPPRAAGLQELAGDRYGSVSISSCRLNHAAGSTVPFKRRWILPILGVAATIATLVLGLTFREHETASSGASVVFSTGLAEHRDIILQDGTRVHLGALGAVTARFNERTRLVVLERGEALFEVIHDAKRPFRVNAGSGTISAVGTKFNVRRWDDRVVVTVAEGIVDVVTPSVTMQPGEPAGGERSSAQRLIRGEEVRYDADGRLDPVRIATAGTSAVWRDGRFKYSGEPLRHVVQDVNRYSTRQVILSDPAAGATLYSGTVFARDIDDWIEGLDKIYPEIEVVNTNERRVLIRMRAPEATRSHL